MSFKTNAPSQRLDYLDLQGLQADAFAMVSTGLHTSSRLDFDGFHDTDPVQMQVTNSEDGMHTPVKGSLDDLLDLELDTLLLSTPTKQKAANSNNDTMAMSHSAASSSGCSMSSPYSDPQGRSDSDLSQKSSERRSETNFLGMRSARLLLASPTGSAAIIQEYTTEQRVDEARTGIFNLATIPDLGSAAGCSRMRDDDSDGDGEQDKSFVNVPSRRSTRTYRRRLFTSNSGSQS